MIRWTPARVAATTKPTLTAMSTWIHSGPPVRCPVKKPRPTVQAAHVPAPSKLIHR
jgi:hypothetical protein